MGKDFKVRGYEGRVRGMGKGVSKVVKRRKLKVTNIKVKDIKPK